MGVLRQAGAVSGIISSRATRTAGRFEERLDGRAYRSVKRGASTSAGVVRSGAASGRDAALRRAAHSEQLTRVGGLVRRGSSELAALPWFSLATDTAAARAGVRDAARTARENPADPRAAVQLAECLRRSEADLRAYRFVRTALHPTSTISRVGLRAGAALGREELAARQSERVGRRAAALAVAALHQQPGGPDALEALSRVAILERRCDDAVALGRAAVRASDGGAHCMVTLSRAHLAAGDRVDAARLAALAVKRGCTVGYEVLADLALGDAMSSDHRQQVAAYERLLDMVEVEDQVAYYGVRRSAGNFARRLLVAQGEKTWRSTTRAARAGGRAALGAGRRVATSKRGSTDGEDD